MIKIKKIHLIYVMILTMFVLTSCSSKDVAVNESESSETQIGGVYFAETNSRVGAKLSDFIIDLLDGSQYSLSKSSKPLFLYFWSIEEELSCIQLNDIQRLYNEYKDKIDFVLIDVLDDKNDLLDFLKENSGITAPIHHDDYGKFIYRYDIYNYPTVIIADEDKVVSYNIAEYSKYEEYKQYIENVIGK